MAKARPTIMKRQRERKREEKRQRKAERAAERRESSAGGLDDLSDIVPGPQPSPWEEFNPGEEEPAEAEEEEESQS